MTWEESGQKKYDGPARRGVYARFFARRDCLLGRAESDDEIWSGPVTPHVVYPDHELLSVAMTWRRLYVEPQEAKSRIEAYL